MGIGKTKINTPANIADMLGQVEINHQIEAEKQEADRLLQEVREAKDVLQETRNSLMEAIKAASNVEMALKAATASSDNIVGGICNAIVDAEQNTVFKATIVPEHLIQLEKLVDDSIIKETKILEKHRALQTKQFEEQESNLKKILRQNEGIWLSDFWTKFLFIFFLVYSSIVALWAYWER